MVHSSNFKPVSCTYIAECALACGLNLGDWVDTIGECTENSESAVSFTLITLRRSLFWRLWWAARGFAILTSLFKSIAALFLWACRSSSWSWLLWLNYWVGSKSFSVDLEISSHYSSLASMCYFASISSFLNPYTCSSVRVETFFPCFQIPYLRL